MNRYVIATGYDEYTLISNVEMYISQGYMPLGGVVLVPTDSYNMKWVQALLRP